MQKENLVVAAVLSGNRNFEGRINPLVKANYLASPPLVVAYALAGTVDIDLQKEPLGTGRMGKPVYLRDIWPTTEEVQEAVGSPSMPEMFRAGIRSSAFEGDGNWKTMPVPAGRRLRVGRGIDLHQAAAVLRPHGRSRRTPIQDLHGHARAGTARRFHHHRPHLAGGLHSEGQSRGHVI